MREIRGVGILGAGTLGRLVGKYMGEKGLTVYITDTSEEALHRAGEFIGNYAHLCESGGFDEQLPNCDLVIECTPEVPDVKMGALRYIDGLADAGAIITTPTSSMVGSRLRGAMGEERWPYFLNTHYLPGVKGLEERPLVEIMGHDRTSPDVMEGMYGFFEGIGLIPIMVRGERPFYIFNEVWFAIKDATLRLIEEGQYVAEVDKAFRVGIPAPLPPCEAMDMVGLDTIRKVEQSKQMYTPEYQPSRLVEAMVDISWLGRKTGKGFYVYDGPEKTPNSGIPELVGTLK